MRYNVLMRLYHKEMKEPIVVEPELTVAGFEIVPIAVGLSWMMMGAAGAESTSLRCCCN